MTVVMLEEVHKIKQVRIVESAMLEAQQTFQVCVFMLKHKLIWRVVHPAEQLITLINDGLTLAPSQNCRKKCGNFDVLFQLILVRNANRVISNKARLIIFPHLEIQKGL